MFNYGLKRILFSHLFSFSICGFRFVRFVSTPEILERIIRIEREILQIESSTQSSEMPTVEEAGHPVEGIWTYPH